MDDPFRVPRLSLLVQSLDDGAGAAVVLEDLRTGARRRFATLQLLGAWLATAPDDVHPTPTHPTGADP